MSNAGLFEFRFDREAIVPVLERCLDELIDRLERQGIEQALQCLFRMDNSIPAFDNV